MIDDHESPLTAAIVALCEEAPAPSLDDEAIMEALSRDFEAIYAASLASAELSPSPG